MRLSFDDEESFKEAIESLRFNSSDPNTRQQMGSSNSMPLEDTERNEDRDNIAPSDPIPLRRRLATVRFGLCSGVLGPNLNLHIEVRFE